MIIGFFLVVVGAGVVFLNFLKICFSDLCSYQRDQSKVKTEPFKCELPYPFEPKHIGLNLNLAFPSLSPMITNYGVQSKPAFQLHRSSSWLSQGTAGRHVPYK